jgi:hypothetical protein
MLKEKNLNKYSSRSSYFAKALTRKANHYKPLKNKQALT